MNPNVKKAIIIFAAAAVGSLGTWAIINWLPSLTILAGGLAAAYVAWLKVK
jgi:hypothetical protein